MTDKTINLIVSLDKEYRTDDAEFIVNAIKMIKGVLSVDINVCGDLVAMNKYAIKQHLKKEFLETLIEIFDKI